MGRDFEVVQAMQSVFLKVHIDFLIETREVGGSTPEGRSEVLELLTSSLVNRHSLTSATR